MTKAELTYLFDMLTLVIEGYGNEVVRSTHIDESRGLCYLVPNDDDAEEQWADWMGSWGEFSGNRYYPVPDGGDNPEQVRTNARDMFNFAQECGRLYDTDTEYGRARIRLAKHLRECVLKELEK